MPNSRPAPPLPKNEGRRLAALRRLKLIDTPPDLAFDRLTRLAARVGGVQSAAVSLIDRDRCWFKSSIRLPVTELPREQTFCAFTVAQQELLVVPDVAADPRFRKAAKATCTRNIRFYAGAPLNSPDGACIGTLCLLDPAPRAVFDQADRANLRDIARLVEDEIARHAESEPRAADDACAVDWEDWAR